MKRPLFIWWWRVLVCSCKPLTPHFDNINTSWHDGQTSLPLWCLMYFLWRGIEPEVYCVFREHNCIFLCSESASIWGIKFWIICRTLCVHGVPLCVCTRECVGTSLSRSSHDSLLVRGTKNPGGSSCRRVVHQQEEQWQNKDSQQHPSLWQSRPCPVPPKRRGDKSKIKAHLLALTNVWLASYPPSTACRR